MTDTPWVFAEKGEWVCCENGHQICCAMRTVHYGQLQEPEKDWGRWRQPEPAIGSLPEDAPCAVCGAPWFDVNGRYHFADGWRPA